MQIIIDGQQEQSFGVSPSLQSVFDLIKNQSRFVRQVHMDGIEVKESDLRSRKIKVKEDSVIEIVTGSLDELIEDTMQSVLDYTPNLYQALEGIVKQFQVGNIAAGASLFVKTVEGISWNCSILSDLANLQPGPSVIHELNESFSEAIPKLLEAWESEDYVLMADIIQYETLPLFARWYQISTIFSQQMSLEHLKH